jgi:hypothetical protein
VLNIPFALPLERAGRPILTRLPQLRAHPRPSGRGWKTRLLTGIPCGPVLCLRSSAPIEHCIHASSCAHIYCDEQYFYWAVRLVFGNKRGN